MLTFIFRDFFYAFLSRYKLYENERISRCLKIFITISRKKRFNNNKCRFFT